MNERTFRRRSVLDSAPGAGVPNMTPMVDVTLVILIFFMASATIAGPEWFLKAELPEQSSRSALALPSPVVRVELFTMNTTTYTRGFGPRQTLDEAITMIRSMDPATASDLVVQIDAADDIAYERVVRLQGALTGQGSTVMFRASE